MLQKEHASGDDDAAVWLDDDGARAGLPLLAEACHDLSAAAEVSVDAAGRQVAREYEGRGAGIWPETAIGADDDDLAVTLKRCGTGGARKVDDEVPARACTSTVLAGAARGQDCEHERGRRSSANALLHRQRHRFKP